MVKYMGIADAHGIESFIPVIGNEEIVSGILIRARLNRQRHAVFYVIDISEIDAKKVSEQINKENYIKALLILKKSKGKLDFPKQINPRKSWHLIPNNNLDPYS